MTPTLIKAWRWVVNMTPTLIKAWRWVVHPKVWPYVGFASAVIGLLCYALSSSFNYLFGKWNLLKIVLYIVFSLIISLMILFPKLQHSTSLWFKAHTAFLALAVTSAYSFFFDNVVNGKPDLHSLISCAAFAIMSLSLSTQTQFGFEMDLLYFFLGCLIVQLMKIKLQLFTVGAAFSYSLIILRSSIDAGANNQNSDLQDGNLEEIVIHPRQLNSADIDRMFDKLNRFMTMLWTEYSGHVKKLVEKYSELVVADPNYLMDALTRETMKGLEETPKDLMSMMGSRFEKDFSNVYINSRRECLNKCLMDKLLGIKDVNNMPGKNLGAEIEKWIKAFKITLKILLPDERRLCDRIFSGSSTTPDSSFVEISRKPTTQLLNFANSIATESHSPEHLFKMIEMFEILRGQILEIESVFCGEYSVSLRNEANPIWKRLGEAIKGILIHEKRSSPDSPPHLAYFSEDMTTIMPPSQRSWCEWLSSDRVEKFINSIPEAKLAAPADGGHHPMMDHVEYYLVSVIRSQQITALSFSVETESIMKMLERIFASKSENYVNNHSLPQFFMMNNWRYLERANKIKKLDTATNVSWFQKNRAKVQEKLELYQSNSWDKILKFLKLDIYDNMEISLAADLMEKNLGLFNIHFTETCRVQCSWSVNDKELREKIIASIKDILLTPYRIFIGKFLEIVKNNPYDYIKYGISRVEGKLDNLFLGSKKDR